MEFREMHLGEGTITYAGESPEYYESKRGKWPIARAILIALLTLVGLLFLVGSLATVTTATVVSEVVLSPDRSVVTLVTVDGHEGSVAGVSSLLPAVGSQQTVMVLPGGRVVLGDRTDESRIIALGFLLGAAWMVIRARRRAGPEPSVRSSSPRVDVPLH